MIEPEEDTIANKTTKKNRRRLRLGNSIFITKRRNVFLANPPDVRSNWDIFERIRNEHSNDDNMQTRILNSKLRCPLIRSTDVTSLIFFGKIHLERLISYRNPGLFSVDFLFSTKTFFRRREKIPLTFPSTPVDFFPSKKRSVQAAIDRRSYWRLYDSRPMALTVSDYSKEYADFVVIERSSNGRKNDYNNKMSTIFYNSFFLLNIIPKQFGIRAIRSSASNSSRSEINVFLCDFLVSD